MAATKEVDPTMTIQQISEIYPEVVETLVVEYGFHCIGCFVAEFETLEEGAAVHGIEGEEFTEMLEQLNRIINKSSE